MVKGQNQNTKKSSYILSLFLQYFQGNDPKHQMLIKSSFKKKKKTFDFIYVTTVLLKFVGSLSSKLVSLFSDKLINNGKWLQLGSIL